MPTQTNFIATSGVNTLLDLSGIFADLDGGTSYGTATNFRVGSFDLTGYFHASTSQDDRPNFNTGYKITVGGVATDLSVVFRRRGSAGLNITQQPASQIKNEGQDCTFTIVATTTSGTLSYQWKKWNGSVYENINQANGATYTTPTLGIGDHDSKYICTVSNGTSTLDSQEAIITVYYAEVTVHPVSNSYNAGDSPTLSVTATSRPTPPLYLWQYSPNNNDPWSDKAGQTNSTLTLTSLVGGPNNQDGGQGYYRCRVRNNDSSTTDFSQPAYIQVYYRAVITSEPTQNPSNPYANGTNDVSISIQANGKTSPTFQWQESSDGGLNWSSLSNGGRISGATTNILTVSDLISADNGRRFQCRVSNKNATNGDFASTDSADIILSVYYITITNQPDNVGPVNHENAVEFTVEANSNPASKTYQWQYSSNLISWTNMGTDPGEVSRQNCNSYNSASLTFEARYSASANDNGYYRCVVSAGGNSVTSSYAQLTVNKQQFTLTVDGGTGGGTKNFDESFNIMADEPAPDTEFWYWSASPNTATIADIYDPNTSCTITQDTTVYGNFRAI